MELTEKNKHYLSLKCRGNNLKITKLESPPCP